MYCRLNSVFKHAVITGHALHLRRLCSYRYSNKRKTGTKRSHCTRKVTGSYCVAHSRGSTPHLRYIHTTLQQLPLLTYRDSRFLRNDSAHLTNHKQPHRCLLLPRSDPRRCWLVHRRRMKGNTSAMAPDRDTKDHLARTHLYKYTQQHLKARSRLDIAPVNLGDPHYLLMPLFPSQNADMSTDVVNVSAAASPPPLQTPC